MMALQSFRRSLLLLVIFAAGCKAQAPGPLTPELARQISNTIRNKFQLPPTVDVNVGQRKASDFPGYDLVSVTLHNEQRSQDYDFLLSKDNKTLVRLDKFDLSDDPASKIDVTGRPVRGKKDAKVTIVSFDDFQCPFCARMHQELFTQVMKDYGDKVRVIYKDYPLSAIHPWAMRAAVNANCLAAQDPDAYWDYADHIHANQKDINDKPDAAARFAELDRSALDVAASRHLDKAKADACIQAQDETNVKKSVELGRSLNIDSTPVLFINGERVLGAIPYPYLVPVIDRALKEAGVQPPPHPTPAAPVAPGSGPTSRVTPDKGTSQGAASSVTPAAANSGASR